MATARDLKNKIRSISNTKKITRTMEMISTAKSRVCQKRIEAVQPYGDKLAEMLRDLGRGGGGADEGGDRFPLLRRPERIAREALIVVTANRGLCGGYNTNVLRLAEHRIDRLAAAGMETEVHMIGKKGASRFRYLGRAVERTYFEFDDRPTYEEADAVLTPILEDFAEGRIDAVSLAHTHYQSASRQYPIERSLLPVLPEGTEGGEETGSGGGGVDFLLEPDPATILNRLLPVSLKTRFFQGLVEAVACEQIARRIAMKNATDNAEEMVKEYTQVYNRTRQAGITQEILEVIGGVEGMD